MSSLVAQVKIILKVCVRSIELNTRGHFEYFGINVLSYIKVIKINVIKSL